MTIMAIFDSLFGILGNSASWAIFVMIGRKPQLRNLRRAHCRNGANGQFIESGMRRTAHNCYKVTTSKLSVNSTSYLETESNEQGE